MPQETSTLTDLFIPRLGKASKFIGMLMNSRLAKTELTLKQFILLTHVKEKGRPQCDLVVITERDKGSLTRLIQSLERKQLVERKVSDTDKRINIVEATALGRKALKKAEKIVLKTFEELKTDITPREEQIVIDTSNKLMVNAQRLLEQPRSRKS